MSRVYVGNLDSRTTERELEDKFHSFGVLRSVWVARKPPGYAFIEFDDRRDAVDAIRELDGKNGWRVEMSRSSRSGGGRARGSGDELKCYECGEPGHFARECRLRIGSGGLGSGRRRSPSPRYRRSPSYGRRYRSSSYDDYYFRMKSFRYSPGFYKDVATGRPAAIQDMIVDTIVPVQVILAAPMEELGAHHIVVTGDVMVIGIDIAGVAVLAEAALQNVVATHLVRDKVTVGHLHLVMVVGFLLMRMEVLLPVIGTKVGADDARER